MYISERARKMEPSATLAVTAKAKSLKREGKPVISFGAGEPDFDSPPSAIRYAEEAMKKGRPTTPRARAFRSFERLSAPITKSISALNILPPTSSSGRSEAPPLRSSGLRHRSGRRSPGLHTRLGELRGTDPLLRRQSGSRGYKQNRLHPRYDDIKKAITPRTRAMIVNTPNNPTGAIYDEQCLRDLGKLAVEHNIVIIFDEIYERLVYCGEKHHQILNLVPEAKDLTIIINGVSKAFAMTGWRIGYALGPSSIMGYLGDLQGHISLQRMLRGPVGLSRCTEGGRPGRQDHAQGFQQERGPHRGAYEGYALHFLTEPRERSMCGSTWTGSLEKLEREGSFRRFRTVQGVP